MRGIEVIDQSNMIIAAKIPQPNRTGSRRSNMAGHERNKNRQVIQYSSNPQGEELLIIVAPLVGKGKIEAWIRVIFSLDHLRREEMELVQRMTFLTLLLMAAGMLGVQWAQKQVSGILQRVITNLQEPLKKLGGGSETPGLAEVKESSGSSIKKTFPWRYRTFSRDCWANRRTCSRRNQKPYRSRLSYLKRKSWTERPI